MQFRAPGLANVQIAVVAHADAHRRGGMDPGPLVCNPCQGRGRLAHGGALRHGGLDDPPNSWLPSPAGLDHQRRRFPRMAHLHVPRARARSCNPRSDERTVSPARSCFEVLLLIVLAWALIALAIAAAMSLA